MNVLDVANKCQFGMPGVSYSILFYTYEKLMQN